MNSTTTTQLERLDRIADLIRTLHLRAGDPERFHLDRDDALRECGRLRKDIDPRAAAGPVHAFRIDPPRHARELAAAAPRRIRG